ncbi:GIY-YIG nuclease family protein [Microbacterium terricola]|uniref:GIY-YIG nuclease family protein n=1 Tax=Microbacterium terricola TaxID=344163 RepID=A0ABM8E272_9MICO|nr:GIY-YIG nuclease family protein [Microbacterium terricola]UYK40397.1 GIY-YIG nuclease family protein [Microbacterium terricola]BDV31885.1 hypothetical protein Microterr_25450 [Microbacterium terricola]
MPTAGSMPGRCILCGAMVGVRRTDGWHCGVCDWRVGDVPDSDLPPPRIEVVYYLRYRERIKIGTSANPKQRLAAIWHEELLAFERGGRMLERRRHVQFAELREGGEWFTAAPPLLAHVADVTAAAGTAAPWDAYARWVSEAYSGR